jgi:hypothetical protein
MNSVFYEANKYTVHAERCCIMNREYKSKKILNKCKMIVVKITKGEPKITGCCDMCTKLVNKYKITIDHDL